jgi:hypothetical protein
MDQGKKKRKRGVEDDSVPSPVSDGASDVFEIEMIMAERITEKVCAHVLDVVGFRFWPTYFPRIHC